jgi:hypothetical protein
MGLFIHSVELDKILNKTNSNLIQGNKLMKNIILTIITALALNFTALAANIGVDTVSSYGGTWSNGSDPASSPFSNWDLWTTGTSTNASAGHYIGAPAAGMANLGNSFVLYGNGAVDTYANAQRTFDGGPLTAGQSFKISLATAWRAGSKGIDLYDSGWNNLFNFNVTADKHFAGGSELLNGANPWGYGADSRWDITATQVNNTQLQVNIVRGSDTYTSGLITGSLSAFKLYAGDLQGSQGERNLYANNLEIIPEPSSSLLMGLGLAGLAVLRRTRKSA